MRNMKVLLDDKEVGVVANGKTESFSIPPGPHFVSVQLGSATCRPLDINPAEGDSVKLYAALKMGLWASSDFVLTREDGTGASSDAPPSKHHGKLVLIFGCVGLIIGLLGLAAAIQGFVDLKKMDRGEMDSSGKGMTLAGAIIGGIGFVLNFAGLIFKYFGPVS